MDYLFLYNADPATGRAGGTDREDRRMRVTQQTAHWETDGVER